MNRATRIEQGLEANPQPEPGFLPTQYLRLGQIYSNEEHFRSQLTIVESQINRLGSSFTWHAREMHPHGDPHYQVDVRPYQSNRMRGAYLLRWRCPTCLYIFNFAQELNQTVDKMERKIQESQHEDVLEELSPLPNNNLMTNPLRYPFPNTADEPDSAS